jgi:hypothetical protein
MMLGRSERQTWPIPLPLGSLEPAEVEVLVNQDEQFMGFGDVQRSVPVRIAPQLAIARAKKRVPGGLKVPAARKALPLANPNPTNLTHQCRSGGSHALEPASVTFDDGRVELTARDRIASGNLCIAHSHVKMGIFCSAAFSIASVRLFLEPGRRPAI